MKSKGTLAIVHKASGQLMGTSRFVDNNDVTETVEIGYTFLAKPYWGTGLNSEIKAPMIAPHDTQGKTDIFLRRRMQRSFTTRSFKTWYSPIGNDQGSRWSTFEVPHASSLVTDPEPNSRTSFVDNTRPLEYSSAVEQAIQASKRYLRSSDAMRAIEANVYWPKWDSPWWHMQILHELGRH